MKFILLLSVLLFIENVLSSTSCTDSYECSSDTISDDYVYCTGYFGCYDADITSTSFCNCDGNYGCYDAEIEMESGVLSCDGDYGCYRAHIVNGDSYTYCRGSYGCYNADIWGYYIQLSGQYAGYGTSITLYSDTETTGYYYAYGYYGAGYGDVASGDMTTVYIYLYGYYSGYNTYIDCESGATCYIYCAGNGCYETEIFTFGTGSVTVSCATATSCPSEFSVALLDEVSSDAELREFRAKRDEQRQIQKVEDEEKWKKEDSLWTEPMSDHEINSLYLEGTSLKSVQSNDLYVGIGISSIFYMVAA
eukprot:283539_1